MIWKIRKWILTDAADFISAMPSEGCFPGIE